MNTINHAKASKCYKFFIIVILAAILLAVIQVPTDIVIGAAYIAFAVISFHWARSLGKKPWPWAVVGLIPCVNLFTTLMLANDTHKACKSNGLKLGFFGGLQPQ